MTLAHGTLIELFPELSDSGGWNRANFDAVSGKCWRETLWKNPPRPRSMRTGKDGRHFYEMLQSDRLGDFPAQNRINQVLWPDGVNACEALNV